MPATKQSIALKELTSRSISLLALSLIASLGGLGSCRSPVSGGPGAVTDLSLAFIVSGAERLSRSASPDAGARPDGSSPRLLLPTATSLEVTLTPESGGAAIRSVPVALGAGDGLVPVTLPDVPYGTYAVKAEAKDGAGVALFAQTAVGLVVDADAGTVTLNLVPVGPAGAALEAATLYDIDIGALPALEARSWLIAPGSRLLEGRNIFLSGLGSEARVYLQAADGTLVSDPQGTVTRLPTAGLPAGEPAYLTVYNGGAATQPASRAFPGPVMVAVTDGTFQRDATPANTSYVSAFSLGRYEVTRSQFQAVMGTDPVTSNSNGTSDPVQSVNWYHAIAFCNKLSLLEGLAPVYSVTGVNFASLDFNSIPKANDTTWNAAEFNATANGYRLPTEMEWRWAAMGATSDRTNGYSGTGINTTGYTKGYAGSTETGGAQVSIVDYAWSSANSGGNTHPVGEKTPNELGIFDMSGNVWEWCWDLHGGTFPSGALVNYSGVNASDERMFVGGSHEDTTGSENIFPISNRRHTNRDPSMIVVTVGFRVARGALPVNLRGGLVGEWLLDGGASDTSGRGAIATFVATPTAAAGRRGPAASAMRLAAGDSISIDAPAVEFSHSSSFTVSLWFNADTTGGQYPYLISELGVPGDFNYFISFNNGSINVCVGQNDLASVSVNAPVSASSWYHVVQVYNGAAVSLYLNGVFIGSETNTFHPTVHAMTPLVLGGGGGGASFVGSLDDIRIYNRVLNHAEIQALYNE